jgi:hypothetical protein
MQKSDGGGPMIRPSQPAIVQEHDQVGKLQFGKQAAQFLVVEADEF